MFHVSNSFCGILKTTPEELHVSALQRYSSAALRDGLDTQTIRDLASLACWGKHMSNAERDLHRMIPFLFGTQIPSHSVCIDVYNPDTTKVEPLEIPVLLASDVVHAIWERNSPKLWDIFIGSTAEKSQSFWSAFSTDPAFANHPVLQLLSSIEMF